MRTKTNNAKSRSRSPLTRSERRTLRALIAGDSATPSAYAAKFSLQHTVSAALSYDDVKFSSFDEKARQNLSKLRRKVTLAAGKDLQSSYPDHWGARIKVRHNSGHSIEIQSNDAKGDPELPLSADELIAKAELLLRHGGRTEADKIVGSVLSAENYNNLI